MHSFLGENWGEGGSDTTSKAWMATMGWGDLKSHSNARLVLALHADGFQHVDWLFILCGRPHLSVVHSCEAHSSRSRSTVMPKGPSSPMETYGRRHSGPADGATGTTIAWKGQGASTMMGRTSKSRGRVARYGEHRYPWLIPEASAAPLTVIFAQNSSMIKLGKKTRFPATTKWVDEQRQGSISNSLVSSSDAEAKGRLISPSALAANFPREHSVRRPAWNHVGPSGILSCRAISSVG